jgi:hypothetical protein
MPAHWTVEIPTSTNGVQVFTYAATEYGVGARDQVLKRASTDAVSERAVRRRSGAEALLTQMKAVWNDPLI